MSFLDSAYADSSSCRRAPSIKRWNELIHEYDEFHWAVAWGSMTGAAKQLLKQPAKFRNVTFGIAFSQTDPALIERLVDIEGARVVDKFAGGTYHPKVYCFPVG